MSILSALDHIWPLVAVGAVGLAVVAALLIDARRTARADRLADESPADFSPGRAPVPPAVDAPAPPPVPICRPLPGHHWPADRHGAHRAADR